jgi:hypothetical protein
MIRNKILESAKKPRTAKMSKKYGHLFAKAVPHPLTTNHWPLSLIVAPLVGAIKTVPNFLTTKN